MWERPIDGLIAELAWELDLPEIALDEQDFLCMQTDGVIFNMDYFREDDVLSFYTTVGEVPTKNRLPLLEALLAANFAWLETGGAALCLDPEAAVVLLTVAMPVSGLDLSLLMQQMQDFAAMAWTWSDRIRQLTGESLAPLRT